MNDRNDHAADQKNQLFEQIWAEYFKRLLRYVLKLTRNKADAENILQDTRLRFIEHMEKTHWNEQIGRLDAYLRRIAYRLYLDLCNRRKREPVSFDDEDTHLPEASYNPADEIYDKIYWKQVFQSLPLKVIFYDFSKYEWRIYYLNSVEKMSPKEIAEEIANVEPIENRSPKQIRYDLTRIKAKIRYRVKAMNIDSPFK